MIKATIKDRVLHVECPLNEQKTSKSGNRILVATTHGEQYIGVVDGKPTYLQMNVNQATVGAVEIGEESEGGEATPTRRRRAA